MSVYLRLFHGRKTVDENLGDWGSDGPVFKFDFVHTTYKHHIKLGLAGDWFADLEYVEDLVYYDGVLYGDWSVFHIEDPDEAQAEFLQKFLAIPVAEKFKVPEALRLKHSQ